MLAFAAACLIASVHSEAVVEHPYDPVTMEQPYIAPPQGGRVAELPTLNRIVYGYLPYWVQLSETAIHWDRLTHFAYFSADLELVNSAPAFKAATKTRLAGARYKSLRDAAKSHGVKFVVTVCEFDDATIAKLIGQYASQTIDLIAEMVVDNGAEGVNIDFEFVPKASKANFVSFMAALTTRLHAEVPGSHVTSATPMMDSVGAYDYDQLLLKSDGMMVMAYGCHWTGSTEAGPNSPLTSGALWWKCSITATIDEYLKFGGVENRKGVIIGLPFYGYQWTTESDAIKAKALSKGKAKTWAAAGALLQSHYAWDAESQTPFGAWAQGGTHTQLWLDDPESFGKKLAAVVEKDLGGIGIWTLGYEGSETRFWDQITLHLTTPGGGQPENQAPYADAGPFQEVDPGTVVVLDGSGSSDAEGATLSYQWHQVAGPAVTLSDETAMAPMFEAVEPGEYRFWLVVSDGALASTPSETQVTVGPAPVPPLSEPDPVPPPENDPLGDAAPALSTPAKQGCSAMAGDQSLAALVATLVFWRRRKSF